MLPLIYLIPLIILIEGFVSIAIEILTIRQLLPVAGGSVIVTSLIIGVFLLFLALGYEKGGRVKEHLIHVLRRNFFIVALISGLGLSYIFIKIFFGLIERAAGANLLIPLTAYLFLVLAPMIYLLGQTLPITINLARHDEAAGRLAGRTMGLSTLGSFLGAVFTTLVLMHFFGVAWTVFTVFVLLMLLTVILCEQRFSALINTILALGCGVIIYAFNISNEMLLFRATTNHANYQILDQHNSSLTRQEKMLVINDVASSLIDNNHHGFKYIEAIKKNLFTDLDMRNSSILVLGAGGFTLSSGDTRNNHFTYVDIDSRIRAAIAPEFRQSLHDQLVINDARSFLNTTSERYNAIVVDVYTDYKAIPAHLLTQEFMLSIRQHLYDKGYAIFNIIANPTYQDAYSKRIDNTIRSVFNNCIAAPTIFRDSASNIVYICMKKDKREDTTIYVDNLNNSTMDAFLR